MQRLTEIVIAGEGRFTLDRAGGLIRGVKILGRESRNGREYTADALRKAIPMYEGIRVNVDHAKSGERRYRDRIGRLENVEFRDGGLFGDLRYNPKHPLAEQLAWDAEHSPGAVGLSHDAMGRTTQRGGKMIVEEIIRVESVDLVANPATTNGLFEDEERRPFPTGEKFTESIGGRPAAAGVDAFVGKLRGEPASDVRAEAFAESIREQR